jgi:hypothetical protein
MFVVAFVFKMSSFQMESLKVMEKFHGGNFHLWKFKMRMMLSKHGPWEFVDGSDTLLQIEEIAIANYNEKYMKAFALLCEHFTDAQLEHIQYCDKKLGRFVINCLKKKNDEKKKPIKFVKITSKCFLLH